MPTPPEPAPPRSAPPESPPPESAPPESTPPKVTPPKPLDPPMVPFALGGLVAWAVAGLVLLAFRDRLAASGHTDWLWICLAGFLVGLPGLAVMLRHDANRRRRRADG